MCFYQGRGIGRQGIGARIRDTMYSSGTLTGRFAPRLPAQMLGERRLARMAARGEQRAFEALFERYHRELYRYCRAVLGESEEAQDALQNTMAAALRHLPQLERRSSLRGWLYRVAHNEAVSILRRRPEPFDPAAMAEPIAAAADAQFEERERLRQLVADLHALPDRQRGALVMRELSDLGYPQIAAAMETSEAGARQLVYEARDSLRTLELGRNLECEAARRVISERDGRMLRGRRLRAHLRACEPCRDFRAAITARRANLAALYPPLVPAATSGLLASLLGEAGHGGAGGALTGATAVAGGGGAALGGAGLKAASIVSVVALGTGAVGVSEELVTPFGDGGDGAVASTAAMAPPSGAAAGPSRADISPRGMGPPARSADKRSRPASADADGPRAERVEAVGGQKDGQRVATTGARAGDPPATPPGHGYSGPPPHAGGPPTAGQPDGRAAGPPAGTPAASGGNSTAATQGPSQGGSATSFSTPQLPPDNAVPSASTRGIPHEGKFEGGTR